MILCETILLGISLALGCYVTCTDLKRGVIENKVLAFAMAAGLIVNLCYYGLYARDFFRVYCLNVGVMFVLSIALYAFHFWAAGDSKLLISMIVLFPARFYDAGGTQSVQGMMILIFIFLTAYFYVTADSVVQLWKRRHFYHRLAVSWKQAGDFAARYAISFLYLRGLDQVFWNICREIYVQNQIVFIFINIFVVMLIQNHKIFTKWYNFALILGCNLFLSQGNGVSHRTFKGYLVLLAAMVLRYFVSGYNYQTVPTEEAEAGMILSYTTVAQFMGSRVKGLPVCTREDMSTRITQEEAEAVRRWGKSKYGKAEIVIVRKIPFAIFIVVGVFAFLAVRIRRI